MPEGNAGDVTIVEVCVRLDDIQSGLMRDLTFNLVVIFVSETTGIIEAESPRTSPVLGNTGIL